RPRQVIQKCAAHLCLIDCAHVEPARRSCFFETESPRFCCFIRESDPVTAVVAREVSHLDLHLAHVRAEIRPSRRQERYRRHHPAENRSRFCIPRPILRAWSHQAAPGRRSRNPSTYVASATPRASAAMLAPSFTRAIDCPLPRYRATICSFAIGTLCGKNCNAESLDT